MMNDIKTFQALDVKSALLVQVANKLKNKEITYEWTNQESDNVGVVALILSGMNPVDFADYMLMVRIDLMMALDKLKIEYDAYDLNFWEPLSRLSRVCAQKSNKKDYRRPMILDKIELVGFSDADINNLQNLSDTKVLNQTNIKTVDNYQHKLVNLIEYLNAWAESVEQKAA